MMTILGKRVKTRQQAVERVNSWMKAFTKEESDAMYKKGNMNFEYYSAIAWKLGIGGWYYDEECTQFCTDKIIEHVMMTHYGHLVEEVVNWRDGQD